MGRDILEDRIGSFKKKKPWRPKEQCPVCAERDRIEHEYLGFLAGAPSRRPADDTGSADEAELRETVTASDGLCAPHFGALLESFKRLPRWLTDFHEEKFDRLYERVCQFIELSAYGRQEEFRRLPEKDQLVWKELALNLRGEGR
jgi:hypothetical protein